MSLAAVPPEGTHQIDMTGFGQKLRTLEVLTDAGPVRVNTNLVSTRTGRRTVVVEFSPADGWTTETNWRGDVTLTRIGGAA